MIVKCNHCNHFFDDKPYRANKNIKGWEEMLLAHYEQHERDAILGKNFTNVGVKP